MMIRRKVVLLAMCFFWLALSPVRIILGQEAGKNEAEASFNKAFTEFQRGDFDAALKLFEQTLASAPSHKGALFFAAVTSQRLGNYQMEVGYYDRLLKVDPKRSVAWSNRAVALQRLGRYSGIEPSFEKALEISPNDAMVYMNRGTCRLLLGQYPEAEADFIKAKELGRPSKYHVWATRLVRQLKGGDLPPEQWRPNIDGYHTDLKLTRPGHLLIDMPQKEDKPGSSPGGLTSLAGYVGTRISFAGSPTQAYEYAPGFLVWQGAVINDPEYGVLLENGTQFRYEVWTGTKKVAKLGKVDAWKFQVAKEEDITQRENKAEQSDPADADKPRR